VEVQAMAQRQKPVMAAQEEHPAAEAAVEVLASTP
jgi:hypothetical protein